MTVAMSTIGRLAARRDPFSSATYDALLDLCNGFFGTSDVACPFCGPSRDAASNRKRRVLRIWLKPGFATYNCARCGAKGWAHDLAAGRPAQHHEWRTQSRQDRGEPDHGYNQRQLEKARWLWRRRDPIASSPAEPYLRDVRKCDCALPGTLGYLAPSKEGHHPALISAFGIPHEPQPGVLQIADLNLRGVHLTLLRPDGSGKADVQPNKIFVGPSKGWPSVIASPTNSLGLAITEGIEDALSLHQALDIGVWAAGAANRMPSLASLVPADVKRVTVYAHNDDDAQGQRSALALADALFQRQIEVFVEGLE